MNRPTRTVVVVGGGTAGWITANLVAAEYPGRDDGLVRVVLVESPDIPTIGVGEGTWPSMRSTLERIGLSEDEFIRATGASFKQGTRFFGWAGNGGDADTYCHPFSLPLEYTSLNPARYWLEQGRQTPFADFVTPQARVIARGLAPKQVETPEYAFTVNYGYHLDAGKFAALLHAHAVGNLGVEYIRGNVRQIESHPDGDVAALALDTGERVGGDLFVDCTGQRALLIGGHYGEPFRSAQQFLFNDRAIAVQVPHAGAGEAIASVTHATAQSAGWVWDIGLGARRGLGHVHSSAHIDEEAAQLALRQYVEWTSPDVDPDALDYRTIAFEPGYRRAPWIRNCVAVGLSAGFVEPLEASALALIEQSAGIIAGQLPRDRQVMDVVATRFNAKMGYHWERIVEFLKLHYTISLRDDSEYWVDNRQADSCPEGLREKLTLWRQQPPWHDDAPRLDELFPSASYQYVLYGMGFRPCHTGADTVSYSRMRERADDVFQGVREQGRRMASLLPTNRELLCAIAQRAGKGSFGWASDGAPGGERA
ncbi:MAG: tryptophan 7-halogenase [Rhodospirillaceae bacterium]|nr:tryptophan 7-halogenase [Rhodospirillaceae bacterium]